MKKIAIIIIFLTSGVTTLLIFSSVNNTFAQRSFELEGAPVRPGTGVVTPPIPIINEGSGASIYTAPPRPKEQLLGPRIVFVSPPKTVAKKKPCDSPGKLYAMNLIRTAVNKFFKDGIQQPRDTYAGAYARIISMITEAFIKRMNDCPFSKKEFSKDFYRIMLERVITDEGLLAGLASKPGGDSGDPLVVLAHLQENISDLAGRIADSFEQAETGDDAGSRRKYGRSAAEVVQEIIKTIIGGGISKPQIIK